MLNFLLVPTKFIIYYFSNDIKVYESGDVFTWTNRPIDFYYKNKNGSIFIVEETGNYFINFHIGIILPLNGKFEFSEVIDDIEELNYYDGYFNDRIKKNFRQNLKISINCTYESYSLAGATNYMKLNIGKKYTLNVKTNHFKTYGDSLSKSSSVIIFKYDSESWARGNFSFNELGLNDLKNIDIDRESFKLHLKRAGIYFFCITISIKQGEKLRIDVKHLNEEKIFSIRRTSFDHFSETISFSYLFEVLDKEIIEFDYIHGEPNYETGSNYFSVFKLKVSKIRPALYAQSRNWIKDLRINEILTFNYICINIGNEWSYNKTTYTIKQKGYYYISLNVGSKQNYYLEISVMKNNVELFKVVKHSKSHFGEDSHSNSAVIYLNYNDYIQVKSHKNSNYDTQNYPPTLMIFFI